jgi:hypothetical protein
MPLIRFFGTNPGEEILVAVTSINIVEQLQAAVRFAAGRGTIGMVGAVVNDRGVPNVPYLLSSMRELQSRYGGFRGWLGDAVPAGVEGTLDANHYEDRGKNSGYLGNLYAMTRGLDAPVVVLQVPDLAIKDASISPGPAVDVEVVVTRAAATYGAYTLPAGTRITDGVAVTPYVVATLEDVTWGETETGDKSVRVRQVSPIANSPVAINTVDTFVDTPADTAVLVATTAVTVPDSIDEAELALRYAQALSKLTDNAPGRQVELVVTDRTEAVIGDSVGNACLTASAKGLFRLGSIAPPLGTEADKARGDVSSPDEVTRTTLQRNYVSYCHPGIQRQFLEDPQLNPEDNYAVTVPSHVAWAFLAAQRKPEENPARPHPMLTEHKIIGIESLDAGEPDLQAHEQAGITQPIIEKGYQSATQEATYHASPMASGGGQGATYFATRRMAFHLYGRYIALSLPYHKALATLSNRNDLLSSIDAFHLRYITQERIAAAAPTQGDWEPTTRQFTVTTAVNEIGNMDVITFKVAFGPSAIEDAGL